MPKQFYTERDIEDLFNSGARSLEVTDDVVLTELAYEKAKRLGFRLITDRADTPPAAPIRPYIANGNPAAPAKLKEAPVASTTPSRRRCPFGSMTQQRGFLDLRQSRWDNCYHHQSPAL